MSRYNEPQDEKDVNRLWTLDERINAKADVVRLDIDALAENVQFCPDELITLFKALIIFSSSYSGIHASESISMLDEAFKQYAAAVAESILTTRKELDESLGSN